MSAVQPYLSPPPRSFRFLPPARLDPRNLAQSSKPGGRRYRCHRWRTHPRTWRSRGGWFRYSDRQAIALLLDWWNSSIANAPDRFGCWHQQSGTVERPGIPRLAPRESQRAGLSRFRGSVRAGSKTGTARYLFAVGRFRDAKCPSLVVALSERAFNL